MQPIEEKTESVETGTAAIGQAESETLSQRAEGILEAVEARNRSAGLISPGNAPPGPTSALAGATLTVAAAKISQTDTVSGSAEDVIGQDSAEASALLVRRRQEVTAACRQAESVREGLAEFAAQLAAAGDAAQEKFGRLVESLETRGGAFGPPGPLLNALSSRVDELAERARKTVDDQLQRLTGLTVEYSRAADGLRDRVDATVAGSRAAAAEMIAERRLELDGIRVGCEQTRDEVRDLGIQVKATLGDDARRRESDHQAIRRSLEEATRQGSEVLAAHGESLLDGLTEKLEEQVGLAATNAHQQMEVVAAQLTESTQQQTERFEQWARKIEETYETIGGQLEQRERAIDEAARQRSETLTRHGESLLNGLAEKLEEQVHLTVTSAQQQMAAAAANLTENTHQRMEEMEERARGLAKTHKTLADRLDLRERALEEAARRLHGLQAEFGAALQTLEDQWKQGRTITEDLDNELDAMAAQAANTIDGNQDAVRELETRFDSMQDRLTGIENERGRLTEAIEGDDQRVASLRADATRIHELVEVEAQRSVALVEEGRRGLDGLDARASALTDQMEKTIASASSNVDRMSHQANHALGQLSEAIGACESAQRTTAATLTDVGGAARQVEELHTTLGDRLATAGERMELLTVLIEQAESVREQQRIEFDEAKQLHIRLEAAVTDGRSTLNEQTQFTADTTADCERGRQSLSVTIAAGERIDEQLTSLNQAGRQITDMVTGNICEAHEASDRLINSLQSTTEQSAAIETRTRATVEDLRRVHDACETTVELYEQRFKRAIDRGAELEKRIGSLHDDLQKRADRAEAAGTVAKSGARSVERGIGRMSQLLKTLSIATQRIATLNEESEEQQAKLCQAMESVAETIGSQKKQWELQQETAKTLSRHHGETRALLTELTAARSDAEGSVENMRAASAEATRASEVFTELFAHVESKQELFADGQKLAKQFVDQAGTIRKTLGALEGQSQGLREELDAALAAPRKLVSEADTHAKQLSEVCKAVRKVFAGLSKVSLQAHERVTTFKELRTSIDERIEQLQSHSHTASETLRQWVTEAAHAQQRLAATLDRAPSIRVTHPTVSLAALTDGGAMASPPTERTDIETMAVAAPVTATQQTQATSVSAPASTTVAATIEPASAAVIDQTNTELQVESTEQKTGTIARMIEDARRRCGITT